MQISSTFKLKDELEHTFWRIILMLVLSRKKNESIVINNDIIVTVVEIRGDKVRLGIVAPKEVPVDREEVHKARNGFQNSQNSSTVPIK